MLFQVLVELNLFLSKTDIGTMTVLSALNARPLWSARDSSQTAPTFYVRNAQRLGLWQPTRKSLNNCFLTFSSDSLLLLCDTFISSLLFRAGQNWIQSRRSLD